MNQNDYIRCSLELHLFFDRIMKEHSFFLEVGFTDKDREFRRKARNFQMTFSDILKEAITLADGRVNREFLSSGKIVTKHTLEAETITSNLSNVRIDTNITKSEIGLKSSGSSFDSQLVSKINNLNNRALPAIRDLIEFKGDILDKVL